jgi:hypothetical protein
MIIADTDPGKYRRHRSWKVTIPLREFDYPFLSFVYDSVDTNQGSGCLVDDPNTFPVINEYYFLLVIIGINTLSLLKPQILYGCITSK